jgi:hypothetical protein
VDDVMLVASLTEALRTRVLPRAKVDGTCIDGVTLEARSRTA